MSLLDPRRLAGLGLLLAVGACGGPDDVSIGLSFRRHALKCSRDGMQARLQVIGAPDCELSVDPVENTVSGLCTGIPTGQERQFRLSYYAPLDPPADPPELELASALRSVDLTDQRDPELVVVFDRIDFWPDDDRDGANNIAEWCAGANPRGP